MSSRHCSRSKFEGGEVSPDFLDLRDPDAGGVGDEHRIVRGVLEDDLMWRVARCRVNAQFVRSEIDAVAALDLDESVAGNRLRFDVVSPLLADGVFRPGDQAGGSIR